MTLREDVDKRIKEEAEDERRLEAEIKRRLEVKQGKSEYVDPVVGGGGRNKPRYTDGTAIGKKMYERIKHRLQGGIR